MTHKQYTPSGRILGEFDYDLGDGLYVIFQDDHYLVERTKPMSLDEVERRIKEAFPSDENSL